jgi:hypothetical protein
MPQLTTASLSSIADRLPILADGDHVVLVEVAVDYTPSFNVGLGKQTIEQFIVTRPRFVPRVCLTSVPCS